MFEIASRRVGDGQPCFVIAEAGVNHNGDVATARRLIDVAVEAKADAVKFQTFRADRLAARDAQKCGYQVETTGSGESQQEMLRRLELSDKAFRELFDHCRRRGIIFLSTPFDEESADFLDSLGMAAFKVPSGEVTNLPFLRHIARKRKPMIVSTGMAYLGEVETAVRTIEQTSGVPLALLHCTSNYPADPADVNLRAMATMRDAFGCPVGYSDHTEGTEIALAAVALGAAVFEKHFTLDRNMEGPDHRASIEPGELAAMIGGMRKVERALGDGRKQPARAEADTAGAVRRSVVAARDIAAGVIIDESMLVLKRPGTGLPPAMRDYLVGRVAKTAIREGELLSLDMIR